MDIQFSHDSKYLLMQVYEGFTHFVVASLETGQSTPLAIPHMDSFVGDDNYVGDLSLLLIVVRMYLFFQYFRLYLQEHHRYEYALGKEVPRLTRIISPQALENNLAQVRNANVDLGEMPLIVIRRG